MENEQLKYKKLLSKKISLWQKMNLTHVEYWYHLQNPYSVRKKHQTDFSMISYATLMSLCNLDRSYIDVFLREHTGIIDRQNNSVQLLIYLGFGIVLYDIGHKDEGIMLLQKAINIWSGKNDEEYVFFFSGVRLNAIKCFNKRLELAKYGFENCENKHAFDPILAKSYIDLKLFDEAEKAIDDIEKHYDDSWANVFKAELLFEKKQFNLAAKLYSKNELPDTLPTWRPQYDYKKALAYYHAGWDKSWQKQAMKIKSRIQWDKYYDFDSVNECGIERNKEIDNIIDSQDKNFSFDIERISHYIKMLTKIIGHFLKNNWHNLFLAIALIIYITRKLNKYL